MQKGIELRRADYKDKYLTDEEVLAVACSCHNTELIALKMDGKVEAWRFRTDTGYTFDVSVEAMRAYGLTGLRAYKSSNLEKRNGILMTKAEREGKRLVQDITSNEDACKALYQKLFQ